VHLYTTDFFPPVVDDPGDYGAIAAANSLSDIYAMGGEAVVVLNMAGFPREWEADTTRPILEAAVEVVRESGAIWIGGHTMRSATPFFGFAVFGEVDESQLVTNRGAEAGDLLYLTKPLGTGSLTTAAMRGEDDGAHTRAAVLGMRRLNRGAAVAMRAAGVRAGTDVTGYGLLGHASNIARGSDKVLHLRAVGLPLYAGAGELAAAGVLSGASGRGRVALEGRVVVEKSVPAWLAALAFDAETSGGVLACVAEARQQDFLDAFPEDARPALVGEVLPGPASVVLS